MTVTTPPRRPAVEHDRELEQRVADLEALIEEARRRARRRQARRGIAALLLGVSGVVAFFGFGGHGGGGAGTAALADKSPATAANTDPPPLGALPPSAGAAKAFAFDPRNPQIVYVLTVGGQSRAHVYKTTDGGGHWLATAAVASGWVGFNEALVADPRRAGTVYAGTERAVYKTVDGGRSWRPSTQGLLAPPSHAYEFNRELGWVTAMAVDPAHTNLVFAGSDRISKSSNGGLSWTTVFPPHPARHPAEHVSALAIAYTRPETIYAIASNYPNPSQTPASAPSTIYQSTDQGVTWQASTTVRGSVSPTALAIDPKHPTTVYAAISGNVMKTVDAGTTWRPITHGLPITHTRGTCHCLSLGGVRALAVDPSGTGTVYAALTQGGIYKTTNGGQAWVRALDEPLDSIFTVAVDPTRPATVFAADYDQTSSLPRILRSADHGHTWATSP